MGTTFLVIAAVLAAFTAISLRPLYAPGPLAIAGWFPAWLVSELPIHFMVGHVVVAAVAIAGGALATWPGWVGLALLLVSLGGLGRHVALANATTEAVERGLAEAFGAGYHDSIDADLRHRYDPSTHLGALAAIFPFRPGSVERVRNLPYARIGRRTLTLDVVRAADPARRIAATAELVARSAGSGEPVVRGAPVFLYVHGGAWIIGHKSQQGRVLLHELAAAGWVCVSINYRLSPVATWPEHILDVKQAIHWVKQNIAEYGGDPEFVIIGGGSAGAHLASLAALTPGVPEWQRDFADVDTAVQGCVAFYGVYDFVDEERHHRNRVFRSLVLERAVMKRRLDDAREEYLKASPIARIGERTPPFLLVHGNSDTIAPVGGARRFRDALRAGKNQCAYVELPGANHAFEIFPSLRSVPVTHGVHRFCQLVYSRHLAARAGAARTGAAPGNSTSR